MSCILVLFTSDAFLCIIKLPCRISVCVCIMVKMLVHSNEWWKGQYSSATTPSSHLTAPKAVTMPKAVTWKLTCICVHDHHHRASRIEFIFRGSLVGHLDSTCWADVVLWMRELHSCDTSYTSANQLSIVSYLCSHAVCDSPSHSRISEMTLLYHIQTTWNQRAEIAAEYLRHRTKRRSCLHVNDISMRRLYIIITKSLH